MIRVGNDRLDDRVAGRGGSRGGSVCYFEIVCVLRLFVRCRGVIDIGRVMMGIVLHAVRGSVVTIVPRRPIGCCLGRVGVLLRGCRRAVGIVLDWDELTSVCISVDINRGVLVDVPVHVVAVVVAEFVIRICVVKVVVVIIIEIDGKHSAVACVVLQHGFEIGELSFLPLGIAVDSSIRFAIRRVYIERLVVCVVRD